MSIDYKKHTEEGSALLPFRLGVNFSL